jgi:small subunit ribosomal protein S20
LPITKSAKKQVITDERRRQANKSVRSLCRGNVVKAGRLITAGDFDAARQAVAVAVESLDRAAAKGVIHSNNAARRKSRLMQKLSKAIAA